MSATLSGRNVCVSVEACVRERERLCAARAKRGREGGREGGRQTNREIETDREIEREISGTRTSSFTLHHHY